MSILSEFRKKRECVRDCKSWFGFSTELKNSCKAWCRNHSGERLDSACQFLEDVLGDQASVTYFGIDCDSNRGVASRRLAEIDEQYGDCIRRYETEQQQISRYSLIILSVSIAMVLIYFVLKI